MKQATKTGIFLVHGLYGHPDEYQELERSLQLLGYPTCAPSLLAHGDRQELYLVDVTVEELIETLRHDLRAFSEICDDVIVVGHSLGGLLSAMLAAEKNEHVGVKNLRALLLVSAPVQSGYFINAFWKLLQLDIKYFFPGLRYIHQGRTGLPRPRFRPWWRGRLKEEAEALFNLASLRLPDIDVPTWLMHSPYDLVVPYDEMLKLANMIDKPDMVTLVPLDQCGHQVFPTSRAQMQVLNTLLNVIQTTSSTSKKVAAVAS